MRARPITTPPPYTTPPHHHTTTAQLVTALGGHLPRRTLCPVHRALLHTTRSLLYNCWRLLLLLLLLLFCPVFLSLLFLCFCSALRCVASRCVAASAPFRSRIHVTLTLTLTFTFFALPVPWASRYACTRLLDVDAPASSTVRVVAGVAYPFPVLYPCRVCRSVPFRTIPYRTTVPYRIVASYRVPSCRALCWYCHARLPACLFVLSVCRSVCLHSWLAGWLASFSSCVCARDVVGAVRDEI